MTNLKPRDTKWKYIIFFLVVLIAVYFAIQYNAKKDVEIFEPEKEEIFTFDLNDNSNVVSDGNLSHITQVTTGGWHIGNPCGVPNFMDAFIVGDFPLYGDLNIGNAKLTIYGDIIHNGYEVTLLCGNSQLIEDETLNLPDSPKVGVYKVYPNPVDTEFFVTGKGISRIEIHDLNGRKAYGARTKSEINRIVRGKLPSGTYLLRIFSINGGIDVKKIIFK